MKPVEADAHLRAALRHAPDAEVAAPADVSAQIIAAAHRSAGERAAPAVRPPTARGRWWLQPWGASGALATVLMAGVIGLMWRGETPGPARMWPRRNWPRYRVQHLHPRHRPRQPKQPMRRRLFRHRPSLPSQRRPQSQGRWQGHQRPNRRRNHRCKPWRPSPVKRWRQRVRPRRLQVRVRPRQRPEWWRRTRPQPLRQRPWQHRHSHRPLQPPPGNALRPARQPWQPWQPWPQRRGGPRHRPATSSAGSPPGA